MAENDASQRGRCSSWTTGDIIKTICLLIFGGCVITVVVMAFIPGSAVQRFMEEFLEWIEGLQFFAAAELIVVTYALGLLFMLPGTPWNLAAGYLFGTWLGSLFAMIGATLGACDAFVLGRTVLRGWATRLMRTRPLLSALDTAIEEHGLKLVLLTRLSPLLPFPLLNFMFGVTRISLLNYFIATLIGLLPLTVAYCWIGSELRNLHDVLHSTGKNPAERYIWLGAAIGGTLLATVLVTIITRNAIKRALLKSAPTVEVVVPGGEGGAGGGGEGARGNDEEALLARV